MDKFDTRLGLILKIILYIIPIVSVLFLVIVLALGFFNLSLLATYAVIPISLASIIFIKFKFIVPMDTKIELKKIYFNLSLIIFFFLYNLLVFIPYQAEVRNINYYIILSLLYLIILLEILFFSYFKNKEKIILIQIILLFIANIYSVTLNYFFFIGRTDVFCHIWLIEDLIQVGHITEEFGIYRPFPLWHILIASLVSLWGVDSTMNRATFLTSGIVYGVLILCVFIISNKILKNNKIALISAFFVSINTDFIFYGMYSIPRSIIIIFQLSLLILFFLPYNIALVICIYILTISAIIYHTASMPFLILQLILFYIFFYTYSFNEEIKLFKVKYIITTLILTIVYWIYYAEELFEALVQNIYLPGISKTFAKGITFSPYEELFNYLHFSPIIFFLFLGLLWGLSSTKNFRLKLFSLICIIFFPLTFPGPFLLISKITNNLNLDRLGEYSFIYICIVCAFGFYSLYSRSKNILKVILVILLFITSFLSVSNDFVASDNPLVKRPFYTFYLTEPEILSINLLAEKAQNSYLMSDYVVTRYLINSKYKSNSHILEVSSINGKFLKNKDDIILIRHSELNKRPLKFLSLKNVKFLLNPSWDSLDYYYNDLDLWNNLYRYSRIYVGKGAVAYI